MGSKNFLSSHNSGPLRDSCLCLNHCCDTLRRVINMIYAGLPIPLMPNCSATALCTHTCGEERCGASLVRRGRRKRNVCAWPHTCPASGSVNTRRAPFLHFHKTLIPSVNCSPPPFKDMTLNDALSAPVRKRSHRKKMKRQNF